MNKKALVLVVLFLILSLPLHIQIVETEPVLDENGIIFIESQDGLLRLREQSDEKTVFTNIDELHKWKINDWGKYDKPKITKIYIGYLMYLTDLNGEKIRKYNSNLYKIILDCNFEQIRFSNKFL